MDRPQHLYVPGEYLDSRYVRKKEILDWAHSQRIKLSHAEKCITGFVKQGRLTKKDRGVFDRRDFELLKKDLAWNDN